ncbi:Peroxidasin-like [Stylophora pistillata]|uniref:Peroxidasin-like n=1 Tax=Stylophora pistillata TaxID=50429 RepID=A0A2B4RFN0_STYPI|nr:Peroxidasin-like [Stylophora pistillata]
MVASWLVHSTQIKWSGFEPRVGTCVVFLVFDYPLGLLTSIMMTTVEGTSGTSEMEQSASASVHKVKVVAPCNSGSGASSSKLSGGTAGLSVSFRISRTPSNPTIVVIGENNTRVRLEWQFSDAPSNYFVQFWRRKPGGDLKQIASSTNGNAFNPGSTSEFEALLPATLTLKNVQSNEEYTYAIILLNSQASELARDTVTIDVLAFPFTNATATELPQIIVPSTPTPLLTIGKNFTLTCNASGDPFPKITWTKDGTPAEEFNVTGYKLHFTNVELKDVGSYRCTAHNRYGYATSVSIASIECNDCQIKTVAITLQSETWKSALSNQQSVEFKILQANVLSEYGLG